MLSLSLPAAWTDFETQGCSVSCGEGIETLTRSCVGAGECIGESILQRPCSNLPVCGKCRNNLIWFSRVDPLNNTKYFITVPLNLY